MHGAALSSVAVATNKAYTAARLRRPTAAVGQRVRHPETASTFPTTAISPHRLRRRPAGLVDGAVVGAVAVSGLTDKEDEDLSAIGIAAILDNKR